MDKIRTAIIFYSATGVNFQLARWAVEAAEEAGADVRLRKVEELSAAGAIESDPERKRNAEDMSGVKMATLEDLDWAEAIVFSAPTRYGNLPAQMQRFIDKTGGLWQSGKLINKVVTGMTSAMNPHGGQETTLLSLYTTMCHWGAIIVPPGYTDAAVFQAGGNPYGTTASADEKGEMKSPEDVRKAVKHQTGRVLSIAALITQKTPEENSVDGPAGRR